MILYEVQYVFYALWIAVGLYLIIWAEWVYNAFLCRKMH